MINEILNNSYSEIKERYENLLDIIPFGYSINKVEFDDYNNPVDFTILEVNKAYEIFTGLKVSEIIGKTLKSVNSNADDEMIKRYCDVAITGIPFELEYFSKSFNKHFKVKVTSNKRNYFTCIFTDISEQKNAVQLINEKIEEYVKLNEELIKTKEKAEESEEQLNELLKNAIFPITVTSDKGDILYLNQSAYTFFGIDNSIPLEKIDAIDFWANKNARQEFIHKLNQKGYLIDFENDFLVNNKTNVKTALVSASIIKFNKHKAILATYNDISERKKLETQLSLAKEYAEESETKYKAAFYTSPDSVTITKLNGEYLEVNEGYTQLTGYSKEEVVGRLSSEIDIWVIPEDRVKLVTGLKANGVIENLETVFRAKDGHFVYCLMSAKILKIKNEQFILLLSKDISDRKKIEIELIAAKEKAEESDRLKTMFLQNLSHEIRTPMNAIIGFSDILNNQDLPTEKRKSYTTIIQNSSKQLLSIVEDILTVSSLETKQEKINIQKVNVNSLIIELVAIYKGLAQAKNLLFNTKVSLADKDSDILTDKTKLTQILTNLITNALKFTHEGFIEFGYTLNMVHEPSELHFYVKDSGIGVKPEMLEKIFDRFRQADKFIQASYGGTGLGLSISKGFAELLGGKIWVESDFNRGSVFHFSIPFNPANETAFNEILKRKNRKSYKIVVAEDEEYNFLYIAELLNNYDFQLIHAKDGKETLEYFNAQQDIDLILMDIKMPNMTGDEAAKIIKSANPYLPIIAQSAYALEHERAKYAGIFDDYITKPINANDLKQKILEKINFERVK